MEAAVEKFLENNTNQDEEICFPELGGDIIYERLFRPGSNIHIIHVLRDSQKYIVRFVEYVGCGKEHLYLCNNLTDVLYAILSVETEVPHKSITTFMLQRIYPQHSTRFLIQNAWGLIKEISEDPEKQSQLSSLIV